MYRMSKNKGLITNLLQTDTSLQHCNQAVSAWF